MGKHHGLMALGIALVLSGCAALTADKEPLRITPKSEVAASPVVRQVLPQPVESAVASSAPSQTLANARTETTGAVPTLANVAPALIAPGAASPVTAPPLVPTGTLYVCTATVNGQLQQTAIEFEPKVRQLCGKHPEMGVCQYERNACRASGGRVHTANGVEITIQTEAEYDKKVMRVRFRAG